MVDVVERLPSEIEASAVKRPAFSTEIVRLDGGDVVTNSRWTRPLAEWDIAIPPCRIDSAEYLAVDALFTATRGSALTFTFRDPVTCVGRAVRIKDDTIEIAGVGNLVAIAMTLEEAR